MIGSRGWVGSAVALLILLVASALALPGYLASRRSTNERQASYHLWVIRRAQDDFRENDRDGNGLKDFWTADIAGLCLIRPLQKDGSLGPRGIGLISPELAAADGDATRGLAEYTTGLSGTERPFASYRPLAGYLFRAAGSDGVETPPLRNDTDATPLYRRCHNLDRVAVFVYPISLLRGKLAFINDQDASARKRHLSERYRVDYSGGPTGSSSVIRDSGERDLDAMTYPRNPSAAGYSMYD